MRKAERPALPSTAAGHQESSACPGGPGDALGRNPAMMFGFSPRSQRGKLPGTAGQTEHAAFLTGNPPPPTRTRPGALLGFFALTKREISPLSHLPFGDLHPGPGSVEMGTLPHAGSGATAPPC